MPQITLISCPTTVTRFPGSHFVLMQVCGPMSTALSSASREKIDLLLSWMWKSLVVRFGLVQAVYLFNYWFSFVLQLFILFHSGWDARTLTKSFIGTCSTRPAFTLLRCSRCQPFPFL